MSRYTDPDSDQYRCQYCEQEKDDHALTVNEAGIVVAGAWKAGEFTICGDDYLLAALTARLAAAEQAERELQGERDALRAALVALTTTEPVAAAEGSQPGHRWGLNALCLLCGAQQIPASAAPFPHAPDCPWVTARAMVGRARGIE